MKAIKALVAAMGILIIAGLGLLGYGLSTQTGKPDAARRADPVAGFGALEIPLPAGTRVDQVLVAGDRVVLRLTGGGERLLVLDPASGTVAGSFVLTPEAPSVPR